MNAVKGLVSEPEPCPWAKFHGPDEPVLMIETTKTIVKAPDGKLRMQEVSNVKTIRLADWDGRCRLCYWRGPFLRYVL